MVTLRSDHEGILKDVSVQLAYLSNVVELLSNRCHEDVVLAGSSRSSIITDCKPSILRMIPQTPGLAASPNTPGRKGLACLPCKVDCQRQAFFVGSLASPMQLPQVQPDCPVEDTTPFNDDVAMPQQAHNDDLVLSRPKLQSADSLMVLPKTITPGKRLKSAGSALSHATESAPMTTTVFDLDAFGAALKQHAVRKATFKSQIGRRLTMAERYKGKSYCNMRALTWLVRTPYFELFFGFLIMANSILLAVQLQYEGLQHCYEHKLQRGCHQPAEERWPGFKSVFTAMQKAFGVIFICELVLKLLGLGRDFPKSTWNWLDTLIVLSWLLYEFQVVEIKNTMMLRLLRLFRLVRVVRLTHTFAIFDVLHLLVGSIRSSMTVLLWSLILLYVMMMVVAMLFCALLTGHTSSKDSPERELVFRYFGTFTRSIFTMWEITLGNWVPCGRLLVDNVSEWFILLILVWRGLIGFAVVTVIRGVFLHETFKVAQTDEDLMIMQKQRMMQQTKKHMYDFFTEADTSGDGEISLSEFVDLASDQRMKAWLAAMDIDLQDAEMLYTMMDNGDGRLSVEDLLNGFSRLKGTAKSIDMCHLVSLVTRMDGRLKSLQEMHFGGCQTEKFSMAS